MKYVAYILYSKKTQKYYIGQTQNIQRRLFYHNKGYSKSTKGGIPWELKFTKEFPTRAEAVQLEKKLKKCKSRKYLKTIINSELT